MKYDRKTTAVILSAGCGTRMGGDVSKQQRMLNGQSVLYHTVHAFDQTDMIGSIVLVVRDEDMSFARDIASTCHKPVTLTVGGADRQASSYIGVKQAEGADFVAIHDGARCLVTREIIEKTVNEAWQFGAACAVSCVSDTVKEVASDGQIKATLDRGTLRLAETPQVFSRELYLSAAAHAAEHGLTVTDDASLVEAFGGVVRAVEHTDINSKITYPKDLLLAEYVLKTREDRR